MHMREADLNSASLFLWHRWFFLPLESAVWQPGVAPFLKYSQYTELNYQEWETSLKLNWTKTVYQRSSPPMAAQVQESILVSKTSIQCTVASLPKMICTLLVLSFLGKGSWKGFCINITNMQCIYVQFSFCLHANLNTYSPAGMPLPFLILPCSLVSFLPNLDFSIKRKYRRSVTIAWACRKNGTSYGLAVDKGGQLVIKASFLVSWQKPCKRRYDNMIVYTFSFDVF